MRRALLAGLVLLAGCGAKPPKAEAPAAKKEVAEAPNGKLAPGRSMVLYSAKADVIFVFPMHGDLFEVPVGTKVTVLADEWEIPNGDRQVRVKIDDGKSAGSVGVVDRQELRPPFAAN